MLYLAKNHQPPPLQTNNGNISRSTHVKFLGRIYDDFMSFEFHIDNFTWRISKHIAWFHQIKDQMPHTHWNVYIMPTPTLCLPTAMQWVYHIVHLSSTITASSKVYMYVHVYLFYYKYSHIYLSIYFMS